LTYVAPSPDHGGVKAVIAVCVALVAGVSAGCGGDDGAAVPVAASSCGRLLYEGEGAPDVVLVSDFPLRGIGAQNTRYMVDAIEFVLRRRGFRAGGYRVGYQSCNDTVGDEPFDTLLCRQNAHAYVETKDVVAVIGPWNSGCAWEQIPILSRRSAGPLAMVSPSNTNAGLTRTIGKGSGAALYPDGIRNYARVVPHDLTQGAAAALLAARLGAHRAVLLHQSLGDDYVRGLASSFLATAKELHLAVRSLRWDERERYAALAAAVAAARPDAVFLAGLTQLNAKRLVEDLRAALGARTTLIAPDSFAASDIARELGQAGEGLYATEPGLPVEQLPVAGRRLLRAMALPPGEVAQTWVPDAAQAAEILLDAIARSDGTRGSVVRQLFATKVENGILGSFSLDRFGDIVPAPVTIHRYHAGDLVTVGVVRVPRDTLGG
jgi:branched-chain amino acid transport system substrate-binding protein